MFGNTSVFMPLTQLHDDEGLQTPDARKAVSHIDMALGDRAVQMHLGSPSGIHVVLLRLEAPLKEVGPELMKAFEYVLPRTLGQPFLPIIGTAVYPYMIVLCSEGVAMAEIGTIFDGRFPKLKPLAHWLAIADNPGFADGYLTKTCLPAN